MNAHELLDQFVLESRECVETIARRLLEVERTPDDRALLDDLFRQVHTLKGNCGLFEFAALERLVHAGEDLLDRVRDGRQRWHAGLADALLETLDCIESFVESIATDGRLPADADPRADRLVTVLRALVAPADGDDTASDDPPDAVTSDAVAGWLDALPAALRGPGRWALRYVPEAECFFKGEDPWFLARTAPGLVHLAPAPLAPWDAAEPFDPYRCNLSITLVCATDADALDEHFRYVPEQLERWPFEATGRSAGSDVAAATGRHAADDPATQATPAGGDIAADSPAARLDRALAALWTGQQRVLADADAVAGTLTAVRTTLSRLLAVRLADDPATLVGVQAGLEALPLEDAALADWAARHDPGATAGAGGPSTAADTRAAAAAGLPTSDTRTGTASGKNTAPHANSGTTPTREPAGAADPRRATGDEPGGARVLKVGQDKVDRLMDLIGEMVVAKNALPYLAQRAEVAFGQRELAREIKAQYAVINRIAEDMQHAIMSVRMLPVGTVFQRFGRLVRDLGRRLGKDVRLVVEGEATEADKTLIEALADPLIHIVRNSLDHGLETPAVRQAAGKPAQGTLRVTARREGDRVVIEVADDGAGVDTARVRAKAVERGLVAADRAASMSEHEALQLIFLPGFSTAEAVSDLSGRGVGMDVVRSAVQRVNGTVSIDSTRGAGTTIRLTLPLSMAVTHVMTIEAGGCRFGMPMDAIVETVRVHADDIHRFKDAQTVVLRGRIVALRSLNALLGLDGEPRCNAQGEHALLVVRHRGEPVGLMIDEFRGTSDILLKPMEGVLTGLVGFAGTALMGDGSVLMVLDPTELL